jgi:hypothetical protein
MRPGAVLAVGVGLVVVGCGGGYSDQQVERNLHEDDALVVRYCLYGSASRAQFNGCVDHVKAGEVRRHFFRTARQKERSNAALYATGATTQCRSDAGPACRAGETLTETEDRIIRIQKRIANP